MKTAYKKLAVALAMTMAIVAILVVTELNSDSPLSHACENATTIAADPQKMKYVKDWITSKIHDDAFMKAIEERGGLFDPRTESERKYIDLDWEYLGLRVPVWVAFDYSDVDRALNASDVLSVTFTAARASFIVKLNESAESGIGWPKGPVTRIESDVFVSCNQQAAG